MELWAWAVIGGLSAIIIALLAKVRLLQKAAGEIEEAFADALSTETNVLIHISTRDRHMRSLAASVNAQLRQLRAQRHRYSQGDMELKNAVTNISHDLRTPLTAICGYLDLLEEEEKSQPLERYLGIIRNRVEMLNQLTEELFRYSVIASAQDGPVREKVSVNRLLEESIAAFYGTLRKQGITPSIRMPREPVVRMLDPSALSRIFSNLLSNAVKYSDGDLDILLSPSGTVTFSNKAFGLDQVQVGRLFDRFYTVESARRSTGLGLAIAKVLTERMGGSIAASYEDGQLSVRVILPDRQDGFF